MKVPTEEQIAEIAEKCMVIGDRVKFGIYEYKIAGATEERARRDLAKAYLQDRGYYR